MKKHALIFTLMLVCHIPLKLYANKYVQDSTIISVKNNFDKIIPKPMKKTNAILSDASGNDLTHNIKEVFLNGDEIKIHDIDSINAKDIKSITTKQLENGEIWLYFETNSPKVNSTNGKTNIAVDNRKE